MENTILPNIHAAKLRLCILDPRAFNFSRVHVYYRLKIWRLSREDFIRPISLFIAPQTLSGTFRRKHLNNPLVRVTIQTNRNEKRFPSWAGEKPPVWAGSVFDHINDHRQLRDTCETQIYRCLKSTGNRLKSAEKHYKSPEKIFSNCLGAGCRRFESCHSDHAEYH